MNRIWAFLLAGLVIAAFDIGCSEDTPGTRAQQSSEDSATETGTATDSGTTADSALDGLTDSDPGIVDDTGHNDTDTVFWWDTENPNLTPGGANNENRRDRLTCTYRTISEDESSFVGEIVVGNANSDYVWNGDIFTIYGVSFTTTSVISRARTADYIPVGYSRTDPSTVYFDFGWLSVFPQNALVTFEVTGTKSGHYPYPTRCIPDYIRGDVVYPEYPRLPLSWWKGKENITMRDLVHNIDIYYQEDVDPITESIFIYNPPHPTQIHIGLPVQMTDVFNDNPNGDGLIVNGYTDLRIFMPSKLLAMGIGFAYQWFKFNPNYFCALGTKENFACGLIPKSTWAGGYPVTIDGEDYSWYYTLSPDGPFQQETGNFIDMAAFLPDYFPPGASHDDYTNVTNPTHANDPRWATSVVSSALSSVVTRETLWAVLGETYHDIVFAARDPWLELSIVTFVYNRGIYSICPTGIFADMDLTLNLEDVGRHFGLAGVGNHVPQINGMVWNMNQAVDRLYDAELSFAEIEAFFAAVRFVYARAMSDTAWNEMLADVRGAFDVLAVHWGGDSVSYRYDFLTLLRVAHAHLPEPTNVRPTSQSWKDRVVQFTCN